MTTDTATMVVLPEQANVGLDMIRENDLDRVVTLAALCHPTRPAHPPLWFLAYPTVGAFDVDHLVGYASFTINLVGEQVTIMGMDVGVHPNFRRFGIAKQLYRARVRLGRAAGATQWLATVQDGDTTILPWMEKRGMQLIRRVNRGWYDGVSDLLVFTGPLNEVD